MSLKRSPKTDLTIEKVADIKKFAEQASAPSTPPQANAEEKPESNSASSPWESLDPKAKNTISTSVWFNEHEKAMLDFLAENERRSIQQTIKLLLLPALKKRAKKVHKAVVDGDEI